MNEKGSNHQLLKQNNYHLIKKCIYQNSPISRVEIARELSLTTPTITGMVTPMIARGLLREQTAQNPEEGKGAGRPRVMLEFVPEAYYICGVDLNPYRINYVLTDLNGNIIACCNTEDKLDEYYKTLDVLCSRIPEFVNEAGIPQEKLLGVGICMPGLIDGSAGKIYTNFQKNWNQHNLSADMGERLGTNVVVENNVRARAICADLFDRSVTADPFAYFFVSFGVACQMIIDGRPLYGLSAAAGEIGHTVMQRGGPVCPTCGNRGCLEALAGERAVLERCRDLMRQGIPTVLRSLSPDPDMLTMEHVLAAQNMGDREVNLIMEDVLDYLGIALANTVNLISPRTVLVDGRILAHPHNQQMLIRAVERNMFRVHVNQTEFRFLPHDPNRGARSAAAVVVREFLYDSNL